MHLQGPCAHIPTRTVQSSPSMGGHHVTGHGIKDVDDVMVVDGWVDWESGILKRGWSQVMSDLAVDSVMDRWF